MKVISSRLVYGAMLLTLAASCAIESSDDWNHGLSEDEDVESVGSPIKKGLPGAVNGATDYCNGTELCLLGEGDCDRNTHCASGLICTANKGPQFGLAADVDVCLPAHCRSERLDGDETSIDCGGSCGSICAPHQCTSLPVGHESKCVPDACICTLGQGDCDSSAACASGLACVFGSGPKFGMPQGHDACAPAHCANRRRDGDETAVDCGGSCGSQGPCVVPSCTGLQSVTFRWLLAVCDSASIPITFSINGTTVASTSQSYSCSCTPGVRTATVTDPALLSRVLVGSNQFAVNAQHPVLWFGWATMTLSFANGNSQVVVLDDVNGGSTNPEQTDVCVAGLDDDHSSPVQTATVDALDCQ